MGKINAEQWLAERKDEIGLSDDELPIARKLMSHNRFQGDFIPLPDFHSELAKQKTKYESEYNEVVEMNREWKDAYDTEYGPALAKLQRLQQAGFDVSGFTTNARQDVRDDRGKTLTAEDIDQMIASRLEPVRETGLAWSTFVADKAVEYRDSYGKKFDATSFRKFGYDNRDKYPTFDSAYEAFTEKERAEKEKADLDKWRNEEREKIRLELMSNTGLPEPGGFDGGAPAFNQTGESDKPVSEDEARRSFAAKFSDLKITI